MGTLLLVSMQRGLKDNRYSVHSFGGNRCLNAKRIESGKPSRSPRQALPLRLNAKRIERDPEKSGWMACIEWSQCKEDWKDIASASDISPLCSVSMQRGLKVFPRGFLKGKTFQVSMQRGLKVCPRCEHAWGFFTCLNAKRIESGFRKCPDLLREHSLNAKRIERGIKVRCTQVPPSGLNAKRIESR